MILLSSKMRTYVPTEEEEQTALFEWAALCKGKYPGLELMFHIPNGGKRSKAEAARFKAAGVKRGVPDIFLPVPMHGYHGLYIEMKRSDGGKPSDQQVLWMKKLHDQGYAVVITHGFDRAVIAIQMYYDGSLRIYDIDTRKEQSDNDHK